MEIWHFPAKKGKNWTGNLISDFAKILFQNFHVTYSVNIRVLINQQHETEFVMVNRLQGTEIPIWAWCLDNKFAMY